MSRRKPPRSGEAIIVPPVERWARGEVERRQEQIVDDKGSPGDPFYVLNTLSAMRRRESITKEMNQAGEQFHAEFVVGQLHAIRAADMSRVPVEGGRPSIEPGRILRAREGIWRAIVVLGGLTSPCGSIAWGVLGEEMTLANWAANQGWVNRPVKRETAAGLLIGTLGVLVVHYGIAEASA